jgi:hypothetical protein
MSRFPHGVVVSCGPGAVYHDDLEIVLRASRETKQLKTAGRSVHYTLAPASYYCQRSSSTEGPDLMEHPMQLARRHRDIDRRLRNTLLSCRRGLTLARPHSKRLSSTFVFAPHALPRMTAQPQNSVRHNCHSCQKEHDFCRLMARCAGSGGASPNLVSMIKALDPGL